MKFISRYPDQERRLIEQRMEDICPRSLIDIQAKLTQANSPGFERWAKTYNLKEIA